MEQAGSNVSEAESEAPQVESDEQLAERAKSGDHDAFEPLVARYAKPVLNFFFRSLGNLEQSEELWQQTFVTAWGRIITFDSERRFKPWLYGIAMNHLRNKWREIKKLPKQLEDTIPDKDRRRPKPKQPDDDAADRETAEVIWQGVRDLSDEQRTVFILRIYHGLTYGEISAILECPEGTAKSRMHFAAEAIRKHLKKKGVS